jgi:DNA-binding transcriptional ArsR family regulator
MVEKRTTKPAIARLFPSPTLLNALALLLLHPDQRFYQREIAERTKSTLLQIQRALIRIEDAGLVEKTRHGNRVYYRARRDHPIYEDLKRVFIKSIALGDQLRDALGDLKGIIRIAFIYGSVAAGLENASSDVDLFIVGQLSSRQAARILGPLGRDLGREINTSIYAQKEFLDKLQAGNQFISQVIAGPKIWLVGSEDELAALVE